ncbi:uncharacterized protein BO80DRAFT_443295 [Aspergillus ibericus CBS 121593]|uniref:Uncharacterized protein n=1 Tax=Aspergillus ibericus CBS 121593 TaxID=1448316 RepID=A0A395H7A4_9EURO|nr:hypothetical protein BO80DRAFT_443295 [Aspergillus ibericus CBS 121593]RAL03045.1 hypothetical protein BO80DRAFT_443295 [Aspergillus ibericus CBS 121593]
MEDKELFNDSFIGRVISFSDPDSEWVLVKKLREFNDQSDPGMFLRWPDKPGGAYGTFLCQDASSKDKKIMRILMQVPYAGSEIAIHAERARQARDQRPTAGQEMLHAYTNLTELGSDFTPRVSERKDGQTSRYRPRSRWTDLYLFLEKLPGKQLGPWFWDLEREERDRVREAFESAWTRCCRAGFRPYGWLTRLFWDGDTNRIDLYNFVEAAKSIPIMSGWTMNGSFGGWWFRPGRIDAF